MKEMLDRVVLYILNFWASDYSSLFKSKEKGSIGKHVL